MNRELKSDCVVSTVIDLPHWRTQRPNPLPPNWLSNLWMFTYYKATEYYAKAFVKSSRTWVAWEAFHYHLFYMQITTSIVFLPHLSSVHYNHAYLNCFGIVLKSSCLYALLVKLWKSEVLLSLLSSRSPQGKLIIDDSQMTQQLCKSLFVRNFRITGCLFFLQTSNTMNQLRFPEFAMHEYRWSINAHKIV